MADLVLERALHEALGAAGGSPPPHLAEALAYAVFPGGGRVRPRLCLEVARACGTADELAYAAACSVELLHCASLVHDDLPCFDAGAMRRGKPSVHRAFGEATAVLVGDGLMVQSFYTLGRAVALRPEVGVYPVLALLEAAGPRVGLVAGQAWELEKQVDLAAYHRGKTASLFEVSAALGALANGAAPSPFVTFGRAFGMAYQLADDVADALADASSLGKPTGKDRELGRPTAMRDVPSADVAIERMVAAARAATEAVPSCPGEADLRRFVDAVFNALVARCLHARAEEPDRAKLSA
ncbi:MAG TPA: polyprenyl synthetase family protein [Labilithrix sp.]|nr:polyprenyl synthetase family protein [Labilithrix sp.]